MKSIPLKKYFILFGVCLVTIVLVLYINSLAHTVKENKLSVSPLNGSVYEININELEEGIKETNQVILYISYTGDDKLYKFEKSLLKIINKYELNDRIIYLNIENANNTSYMNSLRSQLDSHLLNNLVAPAFIYIKNGEVEDVISSTDLPITTQDFENLIKQYEIGN